VSLAATFSAGAFHAVLASTLRCQSDLSDAFEVILSLAPRVAKLHTIAERLLFQLRALRLGVSILGTHNCNHQNLPERNTVKVTVGACLAERVLGGVATRRNSSV
jgi:hypothetical protein